MTTRRATSTTTRRGRRTVAAVIAGLLVASCGGDAAETAKALIESEIEQQIGLGELTATCDQPDKLEQGQTFTCTASTPDDKILTFVGELTSEDRLNVQSTNLLTAADVERLLPAIAEAVAAEVGVEVVATDITCPPGTIIIDDAGDFTCEILDRQTGDVYEIVIQTGGLEPGGGPKDLGFVIGDLVER